MTRLSTWTSSVVWFGVLGALAACPEPPVNPPSDASAAQDAARIDRAGVEGSPVDGSPAERMGDAAASDQAVLDATGPETPASDTSAIEGGAVDSSAAGDAAASCTEAETCASSLGCVDGVCAACSDGAECRTTLREGCHAGVCGACATADDCAAGLGCRVVTGECHSCRVAEECRAGQACVDGACAACSTDSQCTGGLCASGTCTACTPVTDDQACRDGYADQGYACGSDGTCAPTSCAAGTDCQLLKLVCSTAGRCEACADASDCLDSLHGGYAAGTLCVEGRCLEADCLDSTACPDDRPICGSDSRCRACQLASECLDRAGVSAGWVCDPLAGRCAEGDCYPSASTCGTSTDQICGSDFWCRACSEDLECRVALASDAAICEADHCVVGCTPPSMGGDGRVCGSDGRLHGCQADSECALAAGSERSICVDERCSEGCVGGSACASGRVCGADHRCRDCATDAECAVASGNANSVCESPACQVGCVPGAACADGQVCGDNHRCRACGNDSECATASGYEHRICDVDTCADGCTAGSACPGSQVCGTNHRCRGCASDTECKTALGQPVAICVDEACELGCTAGALCSGGQICQGDNRCADCATDAQCATASGRVVEICVDTRCQTGCTSPGPCASGQVCGTDHRCRDCGVNADCTPSTVYGASYLCIAGDCTAAECNVEKPCTNGLVCDPALHFCRSCESQGECGGGQVCDIPAPPGTGRCRPGECTRTTQETLCSSGLCDVTAPDPVNVCVPCGAVACGTSSIGQPRVCDDGVCHVGVCTRDTEVTDCTSGLCNASYQCTSCSSLLECGAGRVCSAPNCIAGNCNIASDCGVVPGTSPLQVCDNHSCRDCGGASADAECKSGYGDLALVCEGGDCVKGCTQHAECPTNFCNPATNRCAACGDDADCGSGRVCDERNGACVTGTCVLDDECPDTANSCYTKSCRDSGGGSMACLPQYLGENQPCSDNDPCTVGERCTLGNCPPGSDKCNDSLGCTTDTCQVAGDQGVCSNNISGNSCVIDDGAGPVCHSYLQFNPANPCEWCDPLAVRPNPQTTWATTPDHIECGGTGSHKQCMGGLCRWDDGQVCASDGDCVSDHCECTDAACTAIYKRCSAVDCNCQYNTNSDGSCDGPIDDGADDPDDTCGAGLSCNGQSGCNLDRGEGCGAAYQCETNSCQCADQLCSATICSDSSCPCRFDSDGISGCNGLLLDGYDDTVDSCGGQSCNGQGDCNLGNNVGCAIDYQCETNQCECTDPACTAGAKRCSAEDCDCRYNADGVGDCEGPINRWADDADNTCAGLSCNGSGGCHVGNTVGCAGDGACESDQCECTESSCSPLLKRCSAADCYCSFNANGDGFCEGLITRWNDDADDTCGSQTCNGGGGCHVANAGGCSLNGQCETDQCECANNTCGYKVCSSADCYCQYSDGWTCSGRNMADGYDDADNSCGSTLSCNGAGGCNLGRGENCGVDWVCETNQCECSDNLCNGKKCSGVDCYCRYNATGGDTCMFAIADGRDDADNSCGTLSCNGSGACHLANGQICGGDADCESNICECGSVDCGVNRCSSGSCPITNCQYVTTTGACTGDITSADALCGLQVCYSGGEPGWRDKCCQSGVCVFGAVCGPCLAN